MRSPGSSIWLVYTASFPSRLMGSTCRYQTPLRVISGPWIAHVGFSALPPRAGAGSSIPRPVRRNGFAFARLAAMRPRNARRPHSDNYLSYGGELNEGTAGWSARGICKLYSELSLAFSEGSVVLGVPQIRSNRGLRVSPCWLGCDSIARDPRERL